MRVVYLRVAPPFTAICPAALRLVASRADDLSVMVMAGRRIWLPFITVVQDDRVLAARRLWRVIGSHRPLRLPHGVFARIDPLGGDVIVGLGGGNFIPFGLGDTGVYLPLSGP